MPKIIRITTSPMALRYLLPDQMRFIKNNGFEVIMISADGREVKEVIANEGCEHIVVPMTRSITPLQDLICLWQLVKIFKREKPDIVHTHTPKAGLLGMMAARFCSVKIRIHTVAGLPLMAEKGFKLALLKEVEKITYSCAMYVWPNSFSLQKFIRENNFVRKEKLEVIGKGSSNGINLQKFNRQSVSEDLINLVKCQIAFSPENIYLLFVGRMVADKGITELVRSFKTLSAENAALRLVLVGPFEEHLDPLPADIYREIKENKTICHIEWSDQIAAYMATCNYFIFPSHREGFPNVLLQAGAMGIPVVCSRIPGNIDIVEDGKTGYIFKMGDENELRSCILKAMANKESTDEIAGNLLKNINDHFDRQIIWNEILKKYKMLLKDKE
ncbi:MAG: glycosyltransferase family 4 protein [Bacteroidetes bacterium]|nr:glycosyltransferase family 4 protein [Bacteroidota bacterium]